MKKLYLTTTITFTLLFVFIVKANAQFADMNAVFVVASIPTNDAETAIEQRLLGMEFDVQVVPEGEATDDAVSDAHLLLISATVSSGTIGSNMPGLADYEIPVIIWEPALYDEMGFSSANGSGFDTVIGDIEIVDPDHPLAAGFTDFVMITTVAKRLTGGAPEGEVDIVAISFDDPSQVVLFGYEEGAATLLGNAPARRVGHFLLNDVADALTDEGWTLFDASVFWAMGEEATSVSEKDAGVPSEYTLSENYPNPFNPSTNISFSVPKQSQIQLTVWNALGEKVATVVNEVRTAGEHTVHFDASNLPSGVYFYRLEAGALSQIKKMLFLK